MRTAAVGLLLLLLAPREEAFKREALRYAELMGLEGKELIFYSEMRNEMCAWVRPEPYVEGFLTDESIVYVGLSTNPRCLPYSPSWLALHEMCHLRMQHIWMVPRLSTEEEEREVRECMRWYKEREGEEVIGR